FSRLEINDQLKFDRLLNWQVARVCSFEDAIYIRGRASELIGLINGIRHQASAHREIFQRKHRWQGPLCDGLDDACPMNRRERRGKHEKAMARFNRKTVEYWFDSIDISNWDRT